jgi:hypothetical protein
MANNDLRPSIGVLAEHFSGERRVALVQRTSVASASWRRSRSNVARAPRRAIRMRRISKSVRGVRATSSLIKGD